MFARSAYQGEYRAEQARTLRAAPKKKRNNIDNAVPATRHLPEVMDDMVEHSLAGEGLDATRPRGRLMQEPS